MGPLTALLGLPVSGPMAGLTWLARQIAQAATQELLDPARIETALLALERRLEAHEIDDATFEAEEERLLRELSEITALRAAEAETDADDEADDPPTPDQTPMSQTPISQTPVSQDREPAAVLGSGRGTGPGQAEAIATTVHVVTARQEAEAWTPA